MTCKPGCSRKLMLRIIPFVMLLYFVSFLDRVNVGFAALSMNKAIGLSPTAFGLGGGTLLHRLFPVRSAVEPDSSQGRRTHLDCARDGVVGASCRRRPRSSSGRTASMRCALCWAWPKRASFPASFCISACGFQRGSARSPRPWFMAAAPISTAIGSPISGAIMKIPPIAGLADWQMLYIIEAVPAIILASSC